MVQCFIVLPAPPQTHKKRRGYEITEMLFKLGHKQKMPLKHAVKKRKRTKAVMLGMFLRDDVCFMEPGPE